MLSKERKLFSHVRLSYVTTTKRALSEADILALQNLKLKADTTLAFAKDMFMFSFYMRGMPFVDIAYLIMMGLKTPLTAYVARHSWASIARDINIPIPVICEGMGHQSYKTTQVYLNSIDVSKISEANRTIIQRIRKGKK